MKNKVLKLLKETKDEFLSGEKISNEFGVSRSAIWKHINKLKEEGYEIESVSGKGYRIIDSPDILTYEEIERYLDTEFIGRNLEYFHSLSSTNIKAKEIGIESEEGTLIIAEEQTKGKGRLGRNWTSPKGKGIWMSIILKPEIDPRKVSKITLIGAAAVNQGLKDIGIDSKIKWPNDIIINNKKVSGILTEMSCELNQIYYVVMGIGINANLNKEDLGENLLDKATSLKMAIGKEVNRKKLLASILNSFEKLYIPFSEKEDLSQSINICRENSCLIGKEVRIIRGDTETLGKTVDIDEEGGLVIDYGDRIESIISGEVSIRGIHGYI